MKCKCALWAIALLLMAYIGSPRTLAADAGTSHDSAPFKITLSTESASISSGHPVELQVTLTNISGKDLTIVRNAVKDRGGLDYKFELHKEGTDIAVPETRLHRALKGREDETFRTSETPMTGSLVFSDLKPGQSLTDTVDLARLYDLTAAGKYVVIAKRIDRNGELVKSNALTITVTD